jgi:hypothetical protein
MESGWKADEAKQGNRDFNQAQMPCRKAFRSRGCQFLPKARTAFIGVFGEGSGEFLFVKRASPAITPQKGG